MKKEFKTTLLVVILCAALLVLVGVLLPAHPAQQQEEPASEQTVVNLVYAYQNAQWNSCVEKVVRQFEADYPNIDIQYEIRYEDMVYEDVLYKLAARDELGDILQVKEPYAWAESGFISPLPADLARRVDTTCTLDGQTYGLCALGTTTGIVYNKAIFAQYGLDVPSTRQEFLDLCETLKAHGVTPLGFGGKDLWHFEHWLNYFLRADILSKEPDFLAQCSAGTRDWGDPLVTEMLTDLNQLFASGYVAENWPSTPDGVLAYHMAENEVAMVFSGPWLAFEAAELEPSLELGWFYVPTAAGQVIAGNSLDVFWCVTNSCAEDEARYEAAITFLNYFYSAPLYEDVCISMAGFSTLSDHTGALQPTDPMLREISSAHENADSHISGYVGDENTPPGFEKRLLTLLSQMCSGELTVAETQELARQAWDEYLRMEVDYEN